MKEFFGLIIALVLIWYCFVYTAETPRPDTVITAETQVPQKKKK